MRMDINLMNEDMDEDKEIRWCENGCGYKLPEEYKEDETICGACLDEMEETNDI